LGDEGMKVIVQELKHHTVAFKKLRAESNKKRDIDDSSFEVENDNGDIECSSDVGLTDEGAKWIAQLIRINTSIHSLALSNLIYCK